MLVYLQSIDTQEEKRKFVILYEKYRYLLLKVAVDILHDWHLAEDAVHEVFMKVANHMEKIREVDSPITKRYLITITKNTAIDIYRKRNRRMENEVSAEEIPWKSEGFTYIETDMENYVLEILKNLPEKYRDVFLLKYSSHLENTEIAEILGITEANVRQRIVRGKLLVQNELDKLGRCN